MKVERGKIVQHSCFIQTEKKLSGKDHEPAYWAIQRGWFARVNALCNLSRKKSRFYHMVIFGYLDHQSTQFSLSASERLMFVSLVLVLINALYGIPNCDDLVS